jgi:LDH2 family malate/lactate/ureidoglycolate dehydrogenase
MAVPAERLRAFVAAAFQKVGMPGGDARTVAALMADADLHGADGHGVFRLPQYIRRIEAGGINLHPRIAIAREKPASALVDGDNGMGHLVMKLAAETAIAKARSSGAAWVGVRRGNHAGPASLYARMPLSHDMVGLYLAVGNANHLPPWGGIEMLLSTNPIAIAVPSGEEPPVVLDMATTVAAYGKVKTKAQRGETMPEGWMVDREGQPLTDPKRASEGFLLPIGGYKGYGLALVFGLLAGTLNGAAMGREVIDFNADDATPTNTGQSILAIDVAAFGDVAQFKHQVDAIARDIRSSRKMRGFDRIWLPGEQSRQKFLERSKTGVPLAAGLLESLDELAARLGIEKLTER